MRTAPPTLPGMPTKNSSPVRPAAAARRARTGRATAEPAPDSSVVAGTGQIDRFELSLQHDPQSRESVIGHEEVRAPTDEQQWRSQCRNCRHHRSQRVDAGHPHQHRDRTAEVVRREGGEGNHSLHPRRKAGQAIRELVAQRVPASVGPGRRVTIDHRLPAPSHSSIAVVRSPAPSVSTRSPRRARRGTCMTRSA